MFSLNPRHESKIYLVFIIVWLFKGFQWLSANIFHWFTSAPKETWLVYLLMIFSGLNLYRFNVGYICRCFPNLRVLTGFVLPSLLTRITLTVPIYRRISQNQFQKEKYYSLMSCKSCFASSNCSIVSVILPASREVSSMLCASSSTITWFFRLIDI